METNADLDRRPSAIDSRAIHAVPVIDISELTGEIHRDLASVQQIADACRKLGFFQVIHHGVVVRKNSIGIAKQPNGTHDVTRRGQVLR